MQVLRLLWRFRGDQQGLQPGESVFDKILDHEFGPVSESGVA